jgi:phosphate transporter
MIMASYVMLTCSQVDFEQFAWTIVFLAMGGVALGKGVTSSGLLEVMDTGIRKVVQGFPLYTVIMILSPIVLVRHSPSMSTKVVSLHTTRLFPLSSVTPSPVYCWFPLPIKLQQTLKGSQDGYSSSSRHSFALLEWECPFLGFPTKLRKHQKSFTLTHHQQIGFRATQENDLGEMYLTNVDFLKNGVPASIVATLVCLR